METSTFSPSGHAADVARHVAVSPDGKLAATVAAGGLIRIWGLPAGTPIACHQLELRSIEGVGFSPHKNQLVTIEDQGDEPNVKAHLVVREWKTGDKVRSIELSDTSDTHFAVSPVEPLAAVAGNEAIVFHDLLTGRVSSRLNRGQELASVSRVMFSPKGDVLLVDCSGAGEVWDVASSSLMYRVRGRVAGGGPAFSPFGNLFAVDRFDDSTGTSLITVYETATGLRLRNLALVGSRIREVGFSTSPYHVFTSDRAARVRIPPSQRERPWISLDIAGKELQRRESPHLAGQVLSAIVHQGEFIITADDTRVLTVWSPPPAQVAVSGDPETKLSARGLDDAWTKLGGQPDLVLSAIARLAQGGEKSVKFLSERAPPAKPIEAVHVRSLIASLESERFEEREAAHTALLAVRGQIESHLRKAIGESKSLEQRRRLTDLLDARADIVLENRQEAAAIRAIHILELIGSESAQAVLRQWAQGARGRRQTVYSNRSSNYRRVLNR
jgi:hypothetical protein